MKNEKELITALKEYIAFLDEYEKGIRPFLHVHGVVTTKEDIEKGKQLRAKIEYLET